MRPELSLICVLGSLKDRLITRYSRGWQSGRAVSSWMENAAKGECTATTEVPPIIATTGVLFWGAR